MATTPIKSLAVLPLQHLKLAPEFALHVNRGVVQAISRKNPELRVIAPAEAQAKIGDAKLIEAYSQALRDYETSGMINKAVFVRVGEALDCDAVLIGDFPELVEQVLGNNRGFTRLVLRYSVISTRSGVLLWEGSANASKNTPPGVTPKLEEVINLAQDTLLKQLPTLH